MNYLICIICFQAILTFVFFVMGKPKAKYELMLSVLLFVISLHFSTKLLFVLVLDHDPRYYQLPTSFGFAYGPLIYLMYLSLNDSLKRFSFSIHLLPFFLHSIFFIYVLLHLHQPSFEPIVNIYDHLSLVLIMSILGYSSYTLYSLYRNKDRDINTPLLALRLKFLRIFSILVLSFGSLILLLLIIESIGIYINLRLTYVFILAVVISVGLYHYYATILGLSKAKEEGSKYESSRLGQKELEIYSSQIEEHFRNNKPYLNSSLTLTLLAEELSIPKHHLTQVLNMRFHKKFYQFVNEYRIQEVIDQLERGGNQTQILAIAFDAGFNSKSTFNNYFKQVTGTTPSDYLRNMTLEG